MNAENERRIEELLRRAPRPQPPEGLEDSLLQVAKSARPASPLRLSAIARARLGWCRWWPVLLPGTLSLACGIVFAVQQKQIRELKNSVQALSAAVTQPKPLLQAQPKPAPVDSPATAAQEVARLKTVAGQLSNEISRLEQVRAENQALRARLAAPPAGFTREELNAADEARARAMKIQCVNNLKQLCLAARMWADDHGGTNPPDILSMSNYMGTPKILVCPADAGRQAASSWSTYNPTNCSYDYLAPTSPSETEPNRVLFCCPIHGTIGLVDGSVQADVLKTHPDWVVKRQGRLYFEPNRTP